MCTIKRAEDMENTVDYEKIERDAKIRQRVMSIITYVLLGMWAVVVLFPFYWMILTSVKSYGEYNSEYIYYIY